MFREGYSQKYCPSSFCERSIDANSDKKTFNYPDVIVSPEYDKPKLISFLKKDTYCN